jgi:hypothetical protein
LKKVIYIIIILVYTGFIILNTIEIGYVEVGYSGKLFSNYLPFMLMIALVTGLAAFYFFTKVFPKGYSMQRKPIKVLTSLLFLLLAFAITVKVFLFINESIGHQSVISVDGIIAKKWSERQNRRSTNYFLSIRDSLSGKYYEFVIKKYIYDLIGEKGSKIDKEFYRGSLGIIYRYSY